ncbi:MAG: AAA family ATPase, partial [Clostridiales bacterium]|nr:AAA family ATPase [Clostridiales bacterium]
KDIVLSEKLSPGFTKILRELQKNGSPEPEFETDEDRTYLITTIRCREGFANGRMGESLGESIVEILSEHMSKLEQKRMYVIIEYLQQNDKIRSNTAAELLNVQIKTAGSLLRKAEKFGILASDGKTKSKVYFLK